MKAVRFHEFGGPEVLKYEDVRTAADPRDTLMQFLQTTYEAGARLANWNRHELERDVRDALASRIYSGTSEIQRNIVSTQLGL